MHGRLLSALGLCIGSIGVSAEAAGIKLQAVRFPNTINGTSGSTQAPTAAPLSQPIVFEFTGTPVLPPSLTSAIKITIDTSNTLGQPIGQAAFGTFDVNGSQIIFHPRLPTDSLPAGFASTSDIGSDLSMPGLLPETVYRIELPLNSPNSIANLTGSKVALPIKFKTVKGTPGDNLVASLFSNGPTGAPKSDKKKLKPKAGSSGLHPNLFSDPAGLFSGIPASKRPPFKLRFTGPLDPTASNISSDRIRLRAVLTDAGVPESVVLSCEPVLAANQEASATVNLFPSTILPLGHTIAIEVSDKLRALSGASASPGPEPATFSEVARYAIANDPQPGLAIDDFLKENFGNVAHQDASIAVDEAKQLAGWDAANVGNLRASFGFAGDGSLGSFSPPDVAMTINLDTDFQTFPLLSGATPQAQPGTEVKFGVFNFTDFHLPPNVTLRARGDHPIVITCTGSCVIEGIIDVQGSEGTSDDTFDSAITPAPGGDGGPGGGRGGNGHNVVTPSSGGSLKFMQTPQFGQSGFAPGNAGPGGGGGGMCGCTMPWSGFAGDPTCTNSGSVGDGSRGSGGGGGSFNVFFPSVPPSPNDKAEDPNVLVSGRRGAIGVSDHLPVVFNPSEVPTKIPPEPACYNAQPGNPTNAVAMLNPNPTFATAWNQGLIYDAGPFYFNITTTWPKTKRVTLPGAAGPGVFTDADDENNYFGPGGELTKIIGGQGGGGAGSRSEGMSQICKALIFNSLGLPFTVLDAKGAGGGGGGGAIMIQALGPIEFKGNVAQILAGGGDGGAGEQISTSDRSGSGGAGSGGCVILQSATAVKLNDPSLQNTVIDVSGGCTKEAAQLPTGATTGTTGAEVRVLQLGEGGPGAPGLVQIHVPPATTGLVNVSHIVGEANVSVLNIGCGAGIADGLELVDVLVPFEKTPTPLTAKSHARSTWYDLGGALGTFRPPVSTTAGPIDGPIFGVPGGAPLFKGTDPATGFVKTDATGAVLDPFGNDIQVDSPDLLRPDFIPNGPSVYQTVQVIFQGADEDVANPGLPDEANASDWVTDITELNGRRFVRWEIVFDIASNPAVIVSPTTPRPQVNLLRVPFRY